MARPGNRHCAICIGTPSFPMGMDAFHTVIVLSVTFLRWFVQSFVLNYKNNMIRY